MASLAVRLTPRTKKKTCLLVFLYIRNAISLFLYFCCINNRIIISFCCVCINFANGTLTWFLFLHLRRYSRLVVEKAGEALLLIWSAFSSHAHTLWISNTVVFDHEVWASATVKRFGPHCPTVWFNPEFVVDQFLRIVTYGGCSDFFPLTCTGTR